MELSGRLQQVQEWLAWQETAKTARECAQAMELSRDSASAALHRLVKYGYASKTQGIGAGAPTRFLATTPQEEEEERSAEYDTGWMAGYESGVEAGLLKGREQGKQEATQSPVQAWKEGNEAGRKQGAHDLGTDVLDLVARMQFQIKQSSPVYVHSKTCWSHHPGCALEGVRRLVVRETGIKEVAAG